MGCSGLYQNNARYQGSCYPSRIDEVVLRSGTEKTDRCADTMGQDRAFDWSERQGGKPPQKEQEIRGTAATGFSLKVKSESAH
jgi:hypothetical protein